MQGIVQVEAVTQGVNGGVSISRTPEASCCAQESIN